MFYLVQANFVNLVILLFLYIFLFTSKNLEKKKKVIFLTGTVCVTILVFADAADFYLQQYDRPILLRYVTSATGYTFRVVVTMFMLFISEKISKKKKLLLLIPLIVNAACAYSSIFTGYMFYFDENNLFHRGPLGLLPFVVCALYLVLLMIFSTNMYRLGDRKEAAVLFLIAAMACIGVLMETGFKFKFLINGITGVSVVFYYLFLNTQTYKRDAMTGALNRHAFYLDIENLTGVQMVIVSVDLNNLKQLNDVFGHDMGDKAIKTVANAIFNVIPMNSQLYRTGGDEFVVLFPRIRIDYVKDIMEQISSDIQKEGFEIAWGTADYRPGMDFEKQLQISDEMMYRNKMKMKRGGGI